MFLNNLEEYDRLAKKKNQQNLSFNNEYIVNVDIRREVHHEIKFDQLDFTPPYMISQNSRKDIIKENLLLAT